MAPKPVTRRMRALPSLATRREAARPIPRDKATRKVRFTPLEGQRLFLEATEPEVLFSGALGGGKTIALCQKAFFLSYAYPENQGLIFRKVAADLPATTLQTLLDEVIPPEFILDHNKSLKRITVRSKDPERPSLIWYRGLDRPVGIRGMRLGWALGDEIIECTEEDWNTIDGRLRLNTVPFHQIGGATNPGAPAHWLYQRFFVERPYECIRCEEDWEPKADACPCGSKKKRLVRRVIQSDAYANPHHPASYLRRLARFKGLYRERFVLGKWVGFTGLVYGGFDPAKHIITRFPIPDDWPRYRSIDFGTVDPFVCLWGAARPEDGALFIYREIYMSGRTVNEHAGTMKEQSRGEHYEWTVADHDAGGRLILDREGIITLAAQKKPMETGIQMTAERLMDNETTKQPLLYFFDDALVEIDQRLEEEEHPVCTVGEFGLYARKKKPDGTVTDEVPKDKWNHGMDALRYMVMELGTRGMRSPRPRYKLEPRAPGEPAPERSSRFPKVPTRRVADALGFSMRRPGRKGLL